MRYSVSSAALLLILILSSGCLFITDNEIAVYYQMDFGKATSIDEWIRHSGEAPLLDNGVLTIRGGADPVLVSDARLDLPPIADFELTMMAKLSENTGWGFVLFIRMDGSRGYGSTGYQLIVKPTVLELGKGSPAGYKKIESQANPVDFSLYHLYRLRVEDNNLKVWIDDVLYFDYTDAGLEYSEVYTEGQFAYKANRSRLQIQSISIHSL